MDNKILYFAYGANMDKGMIRAITGNDRLVGRPAILDGYEIGIQRIDQTPKDVEKLLRNSWGDDFKTYVIYPRLGAKVKGMVWELTETERRLVRNWEFVEKEVGPRFSWYKQVLIDRVSTPEGGTIEGLETEILGDGQEIDGTIKVDGLNYEPYLMNPGEMWRIASEDLKSFLEREGRKKEIC
ncbi:MAG: gamma-glutamylcyclotransferase [Patescibacteria group bacterium]|nr:gamma-glutamylcyclotransferase [Patescibacteria group bacterium]